MAIVLGKTSRERMAHLHPDLIRVLERAARTATPDLDFKVLEGLRSTEQCYINYGKGRTVAQLQAKGVPVKYAKPTLAKVTWLNDPLNSKHCKQADGYSHAFDVAPYPIDWNDLARFDKMAKHVMAAAAAEGVSITWGADWDRDGKPRERGETDSPHFELARR